MFNNERGSALLMAIGAAAVIAVMSLTVATQMTKTNEISKLPRIRSTMAQIEVQLRALAVNPTSFNNCDVTKGAKSCQLISSLFTGLGNQEFAVTAVYIPTALLVSGRIHYNAPQGMVAIQDRIVDVVVPLEVLSGNSFSCPNTSPFFVGYDSSGTAICRPLPGNQCPTGQYVTSIDRMTLLPTCSDIGKTIQCQDMNQFISVYDWQGGTNVAFSCADRPNPFVSPGYSPTVTLGTDVITLPGINDPVPTQPKSPTVNTWPAPGPMPPFDCGALSTPTPTPTPSPLPVPSPSPSPSQCQANQTYTCVTPPALPTPTPAPTQLTCYARYASTPTGGNTMDNLIAAYATLAECEAHPMGKSTGCMVDHYYGDCSQFATPTPAPAPVVAPTPICKCVANPTPTPTPTPGGCKFSLSTSYTHPGGVSGKAVTCIGVGGSMTIPSNSTYVVPLSSICSGAQNCYGSIQANCNNGKLSWTNGVCNIGLPP